MATKSRKRGKPPGVRLGRRGSVQVYRGGVRVKTLSANAVLSMIGRKV